MLEQDGDSVDCAFCSFPVAVAAVEPTGEMRCPGCGARSLPRTGSID